MRKTVWMPIVTVLLAAVVLFAAYNGLSSLRQANARKELDSKLQTILPGSGEFTYEAYTGEDANVLGAYKSDKGYVVMTSTYGYAGDIVMFVGVTKEGAVTGLQVRKMHETFGLGGEALWNVEFLAQFLNTTGDAEVGTNVDALTGATVTSKAVTRSVNSAVAFVTGADVSSGATSWGG